MTRAIVRIPTPLRGFTNGADEVHVEAESVAQALAGLAAGLRERVLDASGGLRPFVNVYVGANDIRTLAGLATPLADGAVLSIVPAVAGGLAADRRARARETARETGCLHARAREGRSAR